ncbi:MAG: phosphogluconate dehydrogenase (NAD(+)-dependent, decarboxylating) [Actinomycetota bacterium]
MARLDYLQSSQRHNGAQDDYLKIGMIGLGRMGGAMATRIRRAGHEVVGYVRDPEITDVKTLKLLVEALAPPRVVWIMVPAGDATEGVIEEISPLLSPDDLVVDGGNSHFRDSIRRGESLNQLRVGFIDAGVSGGVWGLESGYSLMVGGAAEHVRVAMPIFEALATPDAFAHVGPQGSGHFTKMVHNGVEYGMMQALGEGYEMLSASDLPIDIPAALEVWRHGSVVRSWLLDLLVLALKDDPGLTKVRGWAEDSGEGRWTVDEAVNLGVPLHVISAALFARFASRQDEAPAMKVVAALRNQFGGHAVK